MKVDRVAVLDWSAAKGAKMGRDSIWLGVTDAAGTCDVNIPTRALAMQALAELIDGARVSGANLLIGVDFAFGFPVGFAGTLTGTATALSVWDWLTARVTDTPDNISNYRQVAAQMNALFPGGGPFWGNGTRSDVPGLPRHKPPLPEGLGAHRTCDILARESGAWPKSVWQLAGAGAVGAQVLTGLPVLNTLRHRFGDSVAIWPFEMRDAPVIIAEVYPSMLRARVKLACAAGAVADQAQVRLLSQALFAQTQDAVLAQVMRPDQPAATLAQEGWILGTGASAALNAALG